MTIKKELLIACALMIAAACGGAALATSIVFDLINGPGSNYQWDSSFFVTSGGYTLTFSIPGGAAHQNTIPGIPASNNPLLPNNQFPPQTAADATADVDVLERDSTPPRDPPIRCPRRQSAWCCG